MSDPKHIVDEFRYPRLEEYPESRQVSLSAFDAGGRFALSFVSTLLNFRRPSGHDDKFVRLVRNHSRSMQERHAKGGGGKLSRLDFKRFQGKIPKDEAARLLSYICAISDEVMGQSPYDVQIAAVWSLMRGEVAEMGTGEGKSLTAALAAAALAFCGRQVHVITVNDYLAERDFSRFKPFFEALGLSSACIQEKYGVEERRDTYRRDIVFSAAKNIVFDYLRDRTGPQKDSLTGIRSKLARLASSPAAFEGPILSGLDAAIIDEADSVLIDQAATPFILSGGEAALGGLSSSVLARALSVVHNLSEGVHFQKFTALRRVTLLDAGKDLLAEICVDDHDLMGVQPIREHLACQALVALTLLERDKDYIVAAESVQVIDESTGRIMADRQWSDGLHQLVEIKEGLVPSDIKTTLGRITFQQFFPRYRHLCGMSGTVRQAARELWEYYGLYVRRIKPRRPDLRRWMRPRVFGSREAKYVEISKVACANSSSGAATLIGARDLQGSLLCSQALTKAGIPHRTLNAQEAGEEAEIVSRAGRVGQITVATNMAGRGTDIILADQVRAKGGLHVILTELHENRRIDLQLAGRCGRQGDPGQVEFFLSTEDTLFQSEGAWAVRTARFLHSMALPHLVFLFMLIIQKKQTVRMEKMRRRLQTNERQRERTLALSGRLE